jgi:transketolase
MARKATREAYGETLIELCEEGLDVMAVDADLSGSTTSGRFAAHAPHRHINVGIAEQNMVGVAAGLALAGHVAFTGSFAVFGTGRAYDQIRNTVCYAALDVKIAPTHAGISVGPDGGSHQMVEDIALMRVLPNMRVLVPADYMSAKAALRIAANCPGPVYVRMGRAATEPVYTSAEGFAMGRARVLRQGADATIIACGIEVGIALEAAEMLAKSGLECEVIDAFCIKPLDEATLLASIEKTGVAVVCEEHSVIGGLASAVAEMLAEKAKPQILRKNMRRIGVQDRFGSSGATDELLRAYGLDAQSIADAVVS